MMRRANSGKFHPATWWATGFLLVGAAIMSRSHLLIALIAAASVILVILLEKSWWKSLRLYLVLALLVFMTRLAFKIIFNFEPVADTNLKILWDLPLIEIQLWFGEPVHLLGQFSYAAFSSGALDGLRLAAIILAIGMANALANPRTLLKSTPAALYEVATAISMALNLAPQLMTSINRVRQASALRGRSQNLGSLKKLLIPVLEDTIESSIKLAASMSTRGFGRTSEMSKNEVFWVKSCSLASLALFVIGAFLVLTLGLIQPASITTLVTGFLLSVVSLKISSRKQIRTKFKQRKIQLIDLIVLAAPSACFFAAVQGWIS